jgi:hypothetical protein
MLEEIVGIKVAHIRMSMGLLVILSINFPWRIALKGEIET